ncbi:MAG TPA: hypothetical protein VFY41_09890, partial [Nitrososphaeraceae archaeon]|nr:hypothetical protein [Nitrososphaeraceae archaeon]
SISFIDAYLIIVRIWETILLLSFQTVVWDILPHTCQLNLTTICKPIYYNIRRTNTKSGSFPIL